MCSQLIPADGRPVDRRREVVHLETCARSTNFRGFSTPGVEKTVNRPRRSVGALAAANAALRFRRLRQC